MALLKWDEVVDTDFSHVEQVTRHMVQAATRQYLVMRGSVRLMTGRLSSSAELEERRRQAMQPLSEE